MIGGDLHQEHRTPGASSLALIITLLTACLMCQGGSGAGTAKPTPVLQPGIVVEKIENSCEARTAGIQEGDILLSWTQAGSSGKLESPFDLVAVEIEQKPKGAITVQGLRGTQKQSWLLGPDIWGIKARPVFSELTLSIYRDGQRLAAAGRSTEAAERWRAITGSTGPGSTWLRAWLAFRSAELQAEAGQWKEADQAFQEAAQSATAVGPGAEAQVLRAWGKTFAQRSDWQNAEKYYQRALELNSGDSFTRALDLDNLGGLADTRGDSAQASRYYKRSWQIREALAPSSLEAAISLNNLAALADDQSDLVNAEDYARRALAISEKLAPGSLVVATSLFNIGDVAYDRKEMAKAEDHYQRALEIRQRLAPESLAVAISLSRIGNIARNRGELAKAETYYRQALAISQRFAPNSLDVANTLSKIGSLLSDGDPAQAEELYLQALAIRQKLLPGSMLVSDSLTRLGLLNWDRGNLVSAEDNLRQALVLDQKLAPGSVAVAASLDNLGLVEIRRGNLSVAEDYTRQALELYEKLAPSSLHVSGTLTNLGLIAWQRGEFAKAEDYHRRAVAISEKLAPGSLDVAGSLNDLGVVLQDLGQLAEAEDCYRKALAIKQRISPDGLGITSTLNNLGLVAQQRGDLAKAQEYYQQALEIRERLAPGGVGVAWNLNSLGKVVRDRGDPEKAEQYYTRALAIWERLAPQRADMAESLAALAMIARQRGQLDLAAEFYRRALSTLEKQLAHLGGTQTVRAEFRGRYESYYKDYVALLIRQKRTELAFQVLEGSRARALMETLATAHVDIHTGADTGLLTKERSLRAEMNAKSERRSRLLGGKHTEEEIRVVEKELGNLNSAYQAIEAQIQAASPGYAALIQPLPLTVSEVQKQLLDPGTVLLEYSLGEQRSYVFAVTSSSLTAYELPKRQEIEAATRRVHELLATYGRMRGQSELQRQKSQARNQTQYVRASGELSRMVLAPVAALIRDKRILVVADGALQYVPFAALPEPETLALKTSLQRPLIVDHEITYLPSASVVDVLRKEALARKPAAREIAVLADPVFDGHDSRVSSHVSSNGATQTLKARDSNLEQSFDQDLLTRSAQDLGMSRNGKLRLSRLLYSRYEAEAILAAVPSSQTMSALDFSASRATAMNPDLSHYRLIHFATHGLVNSEHPELSGLVLSLVDKDGKPQNGFLQLQDIYNLNLPADLVVLSACETALGKEISGEGLIGLTRGFMYAGASRVVASLWKVSDVATAKLMAEFYRAMEKGGMPPSAALRAAQIKMWKQQRWSDPYYWAAFQIQGEWK